MIFVIFNLSDIHAILVIFSFSDIHMVLVIFSVHNIHMILVIFMDLHFSDIQVLVIYVKVLVIFDALIFSNITK